MLGLGLVQRQPQVMGPDDDVREQAFVGVTAVDQPDKTTSLNRRRHHRL
jgi:hypothetical protein